MGQKTMLLKTLGLVVLATTGAAGEVTLGLSVEPSPMLLGTPFNIQATVRNAGNTAVLVPIELSVGRALYWTIEESPGALLPARQMGHGPTGGTLRTELLEPGATREYTVYWGIQPEYCPRLCVAGKHVFRVTLDVRHWSSDPQAATAASEPVTIVVEAPTGEDKEAYDSLALPHTGLATVDGEPACVPIGVASELTFRGQAELLAKYPGSTYAAYAVREGLRGCSESPKDIVYTLQRSKEDGERHIAGMGVPCEKPCGGLSGLTTLHGDEVLAWREKWFGIALEAHPELFFADQLRFHLAVDHLVTGKLAEGARELETLSMKARPDIAEKAKQLLALIREKGWIK